MEPVTPASAVVPEELAACPPTVVAAKCVLVGASKVGKTSIARLVCQGKATERYQRTVGIDTLHKEIELAEHPLADRQPARVQLYIWDKASENDFTTLEEAFFKGARVGLLVFSSTDRASFDAVKAMKRAAEKTLRLQRDGSDIQWAVVQHKVDGLDEMHVGTGRGQTTGFPAPASPTGELPLHASSSARTAGTAVAEVETAASGFSVKAASSAHSQATVKSGGAGRQRVRPAGLESDATGQPSVQGQLLTKSSPNPARATIVTNDSRSAKSHRCISIAEGRQLAKELGDLPFFETSARQPDSVLAPFTALATSIYLHASSGAAQVAGGAGVGHGGVGIGNVDHLQGSSLAMSNAVPDGGGGGGGSLGSVGVTAVGVGGVVGGVVGSVGGGGASGGAAGSGNAGGGGIRFRETVAMSRIVPEDDDGFPIIAKNTDAPCNQPFKLRKPVMQGNVSGALKVQEQFKTQIYTALCLALSIGVFLLTIYVILPSEHVEVPDEIDPVKQIQQVKGALDGKG